MANETPGAAETGVVRLLKLHEPRLDIRADREMVAVMGASSLSTRQYNADSASTSSIIWSQTTPSVRVGVDRMIEMDVTFSVTLNPDRLDPAGGGGRIPMVVGLGLDDVTEVQPHLVRDANGPRQYPLHSIIENCQVRLNDQAFNWEPSDLIHPLLHYGNVWEDRQYNTGSSAHKPDNYWKYDGQGGGSRAPFVAYNNGVLEDSRSGSLWYRKTGPLSFEVRCIEQIMLSPLSWGEPCQALFGIQNIDVNLTLRRPLERLFSGDMYAQLIQRSNGGIPGPLQPGDRLNMVIDTNNTQCKLHITYLQPQANQIVPMRLNYPFYTVRRFVQDISAPVLPGEQVNGGLINFNNITLHECPKRCYIFARPILPNTPELLNGNPPAAKNHGATDAMRQADFFATIGDGGISFNWDSQDGRLSTLDTYDLWRLSVNNGYKRSFQAWQKYIGSVLCLEFGKDLALSPLVAPGVRGNFQLSFSVDFRDIRNVLNSENPNDNFDETEAKRYKAYLIIVPTGILTIENQLVSVSVGSITEEQVLTAPWADAGTRAEYRGMYGGVKWSSIWSGIKKAAKFAKPILGPLSAGVVGALSASSDPRAQVAAKVLGAMRGSGKTGGAKQVRCASLARRM